MHVTIHYNRTSPLLLHTTPTPTPTPTFNNNNKVLLPIHTHIPPLKTRISCRSTVTVMMGWFPSLECCLPRVSGDERYGGFKSYERHGQTERDASRGHTRASPQREYTFGGDDATQRL